MLEKIIFFHCKLERMLLNYIITKFNEMEVQKNDRGNC